MFRIMIIEEVRAARPLYVERYDPDAMQGYGRVWTTRDPGKAMRFERADDALALWRKQSKVRPIRDDGKPNRPLMAFTVEIEEIRAEQPEEVANG